MKASARPTADQTKIRFWIIDPTLGGELIPSIV